MSVLTHSGTYEDSYSVCVLGLNCASPWGHTGCSPGHWENWLMLSQSWSPSALKSHGEPSRLEESKLCTIIKKGSDDLGSYRPASFASVPRKKHGMSPFRRHGRWRRRRKTVIVELQCLKNVIAFCDKMTRSDQGRAGDGISLTFSEAFSATKAFISRNVAH